MTRVLPAASTITVQSDLQQDYHHAGCRLHGAVVCQQPTKYNIPYLNMGTFAIEDCEITTGQSAAYNHCPRQEEQTGSTTKASSEPAGDSAEFVPCCFPACGGGQKMEDSESKGGKEMRKKALSLLMALCLTATLAPAAFAAEDSTNAWAAIRETNDPEVVFVEDDLPESNVLAPISTVNLTGDGTKNNPYLINNENDFVELCILTRNYAGYIYVDLLADLDLTFCDVAADITGCYINYFDGVFNGNGHTIKGMEPDAYLFYQWHAGEIRDLTLDLQGQPSTLVGTSFRVTSVGDPVGYGETKLSDITVVSDEPIQVDGPAYNNYSFFLYSSGPYFTMEDCVNYADLSGDIYGSPFYGYYPLPLSDYPEDGQITVTNCVNHGNVSLRYAGFVFGNPTGLEDQRDVSISNLKNYGRFSGTESTHAFCSDANVSSIVSSYENGGYFAQVENDILNTSQMELFCDEQGCPHKGQQGSFGKQADLTGFGIIRNEDMSFTINKPSSSDGIAYYEVTAFAYVQIFDDKTNEWLGTSRIGMSQQFKSDAESMTTTLLRDVAIHDGGVKPTNYLIIDDETGLYLDTTNSTYWLDNGEIVHSSQYDYYQYLNQDQTPGTAYWTVYASAYGADGELLASVQYERS